MDLDAEIRAAADDAHRQFAPIVDLIDKILTKAVTHQPPQSWYDEDMTGLCDVDVQPDCVVED